MTDPLQHIEDAAWDYALKDMTELQMIGTMAGIGEQRRNSQRSYKIGRVRNAVQMTRI
jgi:hypothetical protein